MADGEISVTILMANEELKRYREAEELFESLASNLIPEISNNVLEMYRKCFDHLQNVISTETNPIYVVALKEVLTSIDWQRSYCQAGLCYSPIRTSQDGVYESKKCKQNKVSEKHGPTMSLRRDYILSTIRPPNGETLNDIAGLENVKSMLRRSILLPLQLPSLFTGNRKPWNHILLYGPPGTGKTKIVSAIANESRMTLFSISSADLLSSWVGESEKFIKDMFEMACSTEQKSIIFIDEIDSICRKRNKNEGDYSRRIKNQLLIEMDHNLKNRKNCILLSATNCPWDLDVAFIRRHQCRVYIPLPDKLSRLKVLKDQCKGVGVDMSEADWQNMADQTEGYSGADLSNLAMFAIQEPLEDLEKITHPLNSPSECKWMPCTSGSLSSLKTLISSVKQDHIVLRDVKLRDFKKALIAIPKSVTAEEVEKYNDFTAQSK